MTPVDLDYERRTRDSFARQPAMATIGIAIDEIGPGRVVLAMPHRADLTQQHPARSDLLDRDADRRHRRLARERIAGAPFVVGIGGLHRRACVKRGNAIDVYVNLRF